MDGHYSFRRRSRVRLAPRGVSRSVALGTKMYISTYRYRSEVENRLRRTSDLTMISSTIRVEYLNLSKCNEMVPFEIFQISITRVRK